MTALPKVAYGFFSFTEVTDPAAHRSYNEWHQLDHLPEQFPLPGIVYGQRWVSTPACRAARAVSDGDLDPIHYVTCYLMAEPIEQTLDDFFALGAELHRLDRFHSDRRAHLTGPFAVQRAAAAPRVLVSAAAVPYRAHRGVYAIVEEAPFAEGAHDDALLDVPGVAGVWTFTTKPGTASRRWTAGERRVTMCWLDDDPLAVSTRFGPLLADRRRRDPRVTHDLRRALRDDHRVAVGLVRRRVMNLGSRRPVPIQMSDQQGQGQGRARSWTAASTLILAALLFVACGGSSGKSAQPPATTAPAAVSTTTTPPLPDVAPTAADFVNLNSMTRVGDHFLASLNGHLDATLAVARSKQGGVYPVGTLIQLIPTEAMVKRRKGYSPATGDWQFFSLSVSPQGTKIKSSGAQVKNFLGGDCAACHGLAEPRFDFVCGKNHGCAPLGVTDAFIANIQKADPRPRK